MMRINIYTYKVIIGIFVIGTLTSCTGAEIYYPTVETSETMVRIYPDQSEHTLPVLEYYFYNTDTEQGYITRSCDGSGNFEGLLPVGTYQVIATNTNALGVTFSDMHSYELATVSASHLPATRSLLFDKVYSTVMSALTVSDVDTLRYEPVSALLTRTVTLTFTLDEQLSGLVGGLSGMLYGVYPSVHLFSGETAEVEILKSPDTYISYVATAGTSRTWTATMQIFGLYNPKHGETYSNIMPITLNMNGVAVPINIDLTNELSDIIDSFEGNIPVDIPLKFEVEMEWNGIEVFCTVCSWQDGGTGEGEIN